MRYLLQVTLPNGEQYKQAFNTVTSMKDYIMARDFYFTHCDYNTYDLAIKLKQAQGGAL